MSARQAKTHPFEATLGPGPYKFVGMVSIQKPSETNPEGNYHTLPKIEAGMGTCAHCGQGIMNVYMVRTDANKVYGVGSDCLGNLNFQPEEWTKVKLAQRRHNRMLRIERAMKHLEVAKARYIEHRELLTVTPYWQGWDSFASKRHANGTYAFQMDAELKRLERKIANQTLTDSSAKLFLKMLEKGIEQAKIEDRVNNPYNWVPRFK